MEKWVICLNYEYDGFIERECFGWEVLENGEIREMVI